MNIRKYNALKPHQRACFDRAVSMHYTTCVAAAFARVALHARREGESPAELALRVVVPMQGSAMVAL